MGKIQFTPDKQQQQTCIQSKISNEACLEALLKRQFLNLSTNNKEKSTYEKGKYLMQKLQFTPESCSNRPASN